MPSSSQVEAYSIEEFRSAIAEYKNVAGHIHYKFCVD